MRKFGITVVLVVLGLFLAACSGPGGGVAPTTGPGTGKGNVEAEIRAILDQYAQYVIDKDAGGIASLHAFSVRMIGPDGKSEMISRHDLQQRLLDGLLSADVDHFEFANLRIAQAGGTVLARVTAIYSSESDQPDSVEREFTFDKLDGGWQIVAFTVERGERPDGNVGDPGKGSAGGDDDGADPEPGAGAGVDPGEDGGGSDENGGGEQPGAGDPPGNGDPPGQDPDEVWTYRTVRELVSVQLGDSTEYWPIEVGNSWKYGLRYYIDGIIADIGTHEQDVIGELPIRGVRAKIVRTTDGAGQHQSLIGFNDEDNFYYDYGSRNDPEDDWWFWDLPAQLFSVPIAIGDNTFADGTCDTRLTTVTVPAGTFTDVIEINCMRELDGDVWRSMAWFKPGVGFVKYEDVERWADDFGF